MATLVLKDALAGEGQHWYTRTGKPAYTVIGKNGKERPANLRDARELHLVPGQSSITRCASAPQLAAWMQKQAILSALTLPRMPDEAEDIWLARVLDDSKAEGKAAADVGTKVHAAFEQSVRGEPFELLWKEHVDAMHDEIAMTLGGGFIWRAEHSFAHPLGYGCKVDLIDDDGSWLIDHKGKDGPLAEVKTWDEHAMQLAANRRAAGCDRARCAILFYRRDQPEASLIEVPEEELQKGLAMFDGLLAYWKAKNRYDSGWKE